MFAERKYLLFGSLASTQQVTAVYAAILIYIMLPAPPKRNTCTFTSISCLAIYVSTKEVTHK